MRRIAYVLTGLMFAAAAGSCTNNASMLTMLKAVVNPSCLQWFYMGQAGQSSLRRALLVHGAGPLAR